jgi:hypothetical protein
VGFTAEIDVVEAPHLTAIISAQGANAAAPDRLRGAAARISPRRCGTIGKDRKTGVVTLQHACVRAGHKKPAAGGSGDGQPSGDQTARCYQQRQTRLPRHQTQRQRRRGRCHGACQVFCISASSGCSISRRASRALRRGACGGTGLTGTALAEEGRTDAPTSPTTAVRNARLSISLFLAFQPYRSKS